VLLSFLSQVLLDAVVEPSLSLPTLSSVSGYQSVQSFDHFVFAVHSFNNLFLSIFLSLVSFYLPVLQTFSTVQYVTFMQAFFSTEMKLLITTFIFANASQQITLAYLGHI